MNENTKTFGGLSSYNPLDSLKQESVDRMKTALLSASLDDPLSAATAIKQVTIMRVYHQVSRIVQYLDLMDKLESKLYESVETEIINIDSKDITNNFSSLTRLLAIQEKLQKSIIESNKILAPYLEMEQYSAFNSIDASTPVSANILEISASERNQLRENAGAILTELKSLQPAIEE